MAPNSRIILTRHAQAEHNVDLDYSIPDAPLTALGKKQAASLAPQLGAWHDRIDLVVSSPLQRTLETTQLGWGPAIARLGGVGHVVCLPQAQECNAHPCDTGSSRAALEALPQFRGFDFGSLTPDWTSKKGFWAPDGAAIAARAGWVRKWLRDRPEKTIVLVAHGDILRQITADAAGPSGYQWRNAEVRVFVFDEEAVKGSEECFLKQVEDVAVAGGYGPSSTEMDLVGL